MSREESIGQIQDACRQIALALMRIHPAVAGLGHEDTQATILKAAHQLTVELETIKKSVIRLQQRDDTTAL
jgi:hypothetical protein